VIYVVEFGLYISTVRFKELQSALKRFGDEELKQKERNSTRTIGF
jgi:hypothetical protein